MCGFRRYRKRAWKVPEDSGVLVGAGAAAPTVARSKTAADDSAGAGADVVATTLRIAAERLSDGRFVGLWEVEGSFDGAAGADPNGDCALAAWWAGRQLSQLPRLKRSLSQPLELCNERS